MMIKKICLGAVSVVLVASLAGAGWFYWPKVWPRLREARESWQTAPHGDGHTDHDEGEGEAHDTRTDHGEEGHAEGDKAEGEHGAGGHGDEAAPVDLSMSVKEILAARCEHDMPTHQCEECRYEVGVVKVSPSIMVGQPGLKNGLVKTMKVGRQKVATTIDVTGEIQLNENAAAHISPRIPGVIRSVLVDVGAVVKKGDVLFEIRSVELGQALSEYHKTQTMVALSRKNYEREKGLFERKVGSERAMIEAQMAFEEHQAQFKAAELKLHVLGLTEPDLVALESASHTAVAGRLSVRAPLSGTVMEKHAVVGELVEPGKDAMLVADLSDVWVWANIYDQDLASLLERSKEGPIPVKVLVAAFPNRTFAGTLDYVGASMDEHTRTVKVRATAKNEDGLLRPGMFCQVLVPLTTAAEVVAIPKAALLEDEGIHFVFKHAQGDYYVRRAVKKGRSFNGSVEIVEGLEPGETIVADGAFLLKSDVLRSKMGAGCAD